MSTITPTIVQVSNYTPFDGWKVTWAGIGDSDTCTGVSLSNYSDCSIQAFGTFSSASIACQGSNDAASGTDASAHWFSKTNPAGTTIAITAAGGQQVTEASVWTRPVSGSGSSSSVTVVMFFRTSVSPR